MTKIRVACVGVIRFEPGQSDDCDVIAEAAALLALKDAGISYDQTQQALAGCVYSDSTAGKQLKAQLRAPVWKGKHRNVA